MFALVLLVSLAASTFASAPHAGAQSADDGVAYQVSAELFRKVDALASDLALVDSTIADTEARRDDASARIESGGPRYDEALASRNAAFERLSRYAVSAYVQGGVVQSGLVDSMLDAGGDDLDLEGRRVLSVTIHGELVEGARAAGSRLDSAGSALDEAEADHAGAEAELSDLARRRVSVEAELSSTRSAADQARVADEARERLAAAKAEDDRRRVAEDALRAATPRPESVRSGVIPSAAVRAEIIAKLGGEVPPTAMNAYWRAASLANATHPDCQVDWALIAAIGRVETNHGRYRGSVVAPDGSTSPTILGIPLDGRSGTARIRDTDGGVLDGDPTVDRAVGPMQFIPGTWRAFAVDGNGDGIADPHNIYDSALAAGGYLCVTGRGPLSNLDNASRAVYAYNRSSAYNAEVLTLADHYRRTVDPALPTQVPPSTVPTDIDDLPPAASPDDTLPPVDPDPTDTTVTSTSTTTTTAPGG